jgi:hypothetical protein
MTYSNSTHFSEQLSYKILFISSYGLKDTNFARFKHLQQNSEKNSKRGGLKLGRTLDEEATDSNCRTGRETSGSDLGPRPSGAGSEQKQ